ncbi:MAG: O-antigen ligase family protein [Pseudomonas sp.]
MALKRLAKDVGLLILSLGMLLHFVGMLFITDGSRLTTLLNLSLFLPALLLTVLVPAYRAKLRSIALLAVLPFLLFTVLVAWLNTHSDHSVKDQVKVALYVLLYLWAIVILVLEDKLERLLNLAFWLASVAAAASLIYQGAVLGQDLFGRFRISNLGYGDYADFNNAIVSALYYAVFAVYGGHQLVSKPKAFWLRLLWAAGVGVLVAYVLCTDSRGVWLGMLAGFLVSIVAHLPAGRRARLALLAVPVIGVALVIKYVLGKTGRGLSLRDQIWGSWYHRLDEFWLTGAGAGNPFNVCVDDVHCYKQAHNLFLQTGYEYGLLAVLLMLAMVAVLALRTLRRQHWQAPLDTVGLALMVFALTCAMANYHTVLSRPGVYWLVFWLPVGLLIAARLRAEQREAAAGIANPG